MTTGFDLIIDSLFPSRKKSTPGIFLPAGQDILDMLDEVAFDQEFTAEELATMIFRKGVIEYYQTNNNLTRKWEALSDRQKEVAALACQDYSNNQIADKLNISLGTVKTHISDVLKTFNARGRHQLRYMLRKWDFSSYEDQDRPA